MMTHPADKTELEARRVAYPADLLPETVPDETPAYVPEPLFPRRVMIKWASITLAVWFALAVIGPMLISIVKEVVAETVVEVGAEPGTLVGPGSEAIISTRNGTRVIRTPEGITILRPGKPPVVIKSRESPVGPIRIGTGAEPVVAPPLPPAEPKKSP